VEPQTRVEGGTLLLSDDGLSVHGTEYGAERP
jgi:hypothetical protein